MSFLLLFLFVLFLALKPYSFKAGFFTLILQGGGGEGALQRSPFYNFKATNAMVTKITQNNMPIISFSRDNLIGVILFNLLVESKFP